MAAPLITGYTEEAAVAAATAGHRMAGMEPTAADVAAGRRVFRGESTPEQEADRIYAEILARRQ